MNSESNRVKLVTILLNISQVACGGNVIGNKSRCISWQQGFPLQIYRCLVKDETFQCLGKPALASSNISNSNIFNPNIAPTCLSELMQSVLRFIRIQK